MTIIREEKAEVETRWWITIPVNRFVFEVFVSRYYPTLQVEEYLSDQGWKSAPVGGMLEPALVLDARLVSVLQSVGVLDSGEIVDAIRSLVEKCSQAALEASEPDSRSDTHSDPGKAL